MPIADLRLLLEYHEAVRLDKENAAALVRLCASGGLLALGSKWAKDALRLVRLPALRTVPNWPTAKTPLHYVTALALQGDKLAIGNDRGRVLLYRLAKS